LAVPVPMGFLALQVQPIDPLTLEAEIKAIAYGKSRYYDIRGAVQYKVFPFVFLSAGYKTQNIKIDQSDISTDMTFSGPILEIGVKF
ncbi:MAG: hypothetical protein HY610_01545, partial [Elusimicrobia bacterium]|nr:hypothetical protein [Elusimicrobiota bacterium]